MSNNTLDPILHPWQKSTAQLLQTLFRPFYFSPYLQGLYIYGPPGRGKTYLVDNAGKNSLSPIVRHHFFSLCALLQERFHQKKENNFEDFFKHVPKKTVYIVDELIIEDITDAMIFSRWLKELTKKGFRLIITSNLSPETLYLGGLKRDYFLPTIELIKQYCHKIKLFEGEDLRQKGTESSQVFFPPEKKAEAIAIVKEPFSEKTFTLGTSRHLITYAYNGHQIAVSVTNLFSDLAGKFDYRYLTNQFKIFILCHLNLFEWNNPHWCKRFIAFIDYAFDHQVKIYFHGLASLEEMKKSLCLYQWPERTYSRLIEISSESWLVK